MLLLQYIFVFLSILFKINDSGSPESSFFAQRIKSSSSIYFSKNSFRDQRKVFFDIFSSVCFLKDENLIQTLSCPFIKPFSVSESFSFRLYSLKAFYINLCQKRNIDGFLMFFS